MEDPESPAGSRVEAADIAFHIDSALGLFAGKVRCANDDGVAGNDRRSLKSDVGIDRIHRLIVVQAEIDDASIAERW